MSHHIYHTEAFILDSREVGEANRAFSLFTRELGLVVATAQGVRLLKSKLRYTLQDYAHVKVDLVRGKEIWRVVSGGPTPPQLAHDILLPLYARVCKLVLRLCHGEEKNEELFEIMLDFFNYSESVDEETVKEYFAPLEIVLVLKVLYTLGYIGDSSIIELFIAKKFGEINLQNVMSQKNVFVSYINLALSESHL